LPSEPSLCQSSRPTLHLGKTQPSTGLTTIILVLTVGSLYHMNMHFRRGDVKLGNFRTIEERTSHNAVIHIVLYKYLGTVLHTPCAIFRSVAKRRPRDPKTYNSGDSLVVTHLTTNPPVSCLNRAERTGSLALKILWSYVEELVGCGGVISSGNPIPIFHSVRSCADHCKSGVENDGKAKGGMIMLPAPTSAPPNIFSTSFCIVVSKGSTVGEDVTYPIDIIDGIQSITECWPPSHPITSVNNRVGTIGIASTLLCSTGHQRAIGGCDTTVRRHGYRRWHIKGTPIRKRYGTRECVDPGC
jgi:hypothetical protein